MAAGDPNVVAGEFNNGIFEIIAVFVGVDREAHSATAVDGIDVVVVAFCIMPGDLLSSVGERGVQSDVFGGARVDDDVIVADLIF